MIKKNAVILYTFLCIVLSLNYGLAQQENIVNSFLTIGSYEWQGCGLINSMNRSCDKDIELPEDTISALIRKRIGAKNIGTGFIYEYNDKKYVVTCEHVILKAGKILGYDSAYRAYELRLIGGDTFYDIAVLEFINEEDATKFQSVKLETEPPKRATLVQSMGYWYNNQLSSFSGNVLGNKPCIENGKKLHIPKLNLIKSTAKSPKGHSGGVLLNSKGRVLGMNVIRSSHYYYALQSRVIERIVKQIAEHGSVRRVFTGVQFAQLVDSEGHPVGRVGVNEIISNSPAAEYRDQLQNQPVTSINGKRVTSIYDVLQIMEGVSPGDEVKLGFDTMSFTINSELLDRERLRQIAEHTIQYHKDVRIKGETIIIDSDEKQEVATIAGVKSVAAYCINSVEQLGELIRIFGFHRRIKIGTDYNIRQSGREIYFSNDSKMILYY